MASLLLHDDDRPITSCHTTKILASLKSTVLTTFAMLTWVGSITLCPVWRDEGVIAWHVILKQWWHAE
jgi:hypothetical protein